MGSYSGLRLADPLRAITHLLVDDHRAAGVIYLRVVARSALHLRAAPRPRGSDSSRSFAPIAPLKRLCACLARLGQGRNGQLWSLRPIPTAVARASPSAVRGDGR